MNKIEILKKAALIVLMAVIIPCSSDAALYTGYWSSDAGEISLGTWSETFNADNYPDFTGSISNQYSNAMYFGKNTWKIENYTVTSTDGGGPVVWDGNSGVFVQHFNEGYSNGDFEFLFSDGQFYTAKVDGTIEFDLTFDSSQKYLDMINIKGESWGSIIEDPSFMIHTYAEYTEDYNNRTYFDDLFNDTHGGLVTKIETTISAVPIPGALWLFASGLLGFIGIRRRSGK